MKPVDPGHPLYGLFTELVGESLAERHLPADPGVDAYLVDLLVRFLHSDQVFAVQREGRPVLSVIELTAEADVRLNAASFERERQVHRHIGDTILFWGSLYPDFLRRLKLGEGFDVVCDYSSQGRESYYIVSTFDYPPFGEEAPTFKRLSEGFADYSIALSDVAESLPFSA
jgi:hypothetical protein